MQSRSSSSGLPLLNVTCEYPTPTANSLSNAARAEVVMQPTVPTRARRSPVRMVGISSAIPLSRVAAIVVAASLAAGAAPSPDNPLAPPPDTARVAFTEDWSSGRIEPAKWYLLRKRWGEGNNGVVPENVRVDRDKVGGREKNVLVCEAHGDRYDGTVIGEGGRKQRVGGGVVSKPYFASGRFEIVMKLGSTRREEGAPEDPTSPAGCVPAIWTYAYRFARVPRDRAGE